VSNRLVLVGAPVTANNRYKESRPLAYVYFKKPWLLFVLRKSSGAGRLVVEPVGQELKPFALEVERLIQERIDHDPTKSFICPDPSPGHPGGRKVVGVDDPNVLKAIQHDFYLWGESGRDIIAGYRVLSTYSHIEDR
jgi:hypothetical protein